MRNDVKDQFLRVLLSPRTLQRRYLKPQAVRSLVDEHVRGRRNRSGLVWRMLALELSRRNFMESRNQWSAEHGPAGIFAHETGQVSQPETSVVSAQREGAPN
jgi:hypothetical protein